MFSEVSHAIDHLASVGQQVTDSESLAARRQNKTLLSNVTRRNFYAAGWKRNTSYRITILRDQQYQ